MSQNTPINVAAATQTLIAAGKTGAFIAVRGYVLLSGGTNTAELAIGGGATLTGPLPLSANGGAVVPLAPWNALKSEPDYWFLLPENTDLVLNTTATAQLSGHVSWFYKEK